MRDPRPKTASLYRMVMDKHVCPYGVKSKWLLKRKGYEVDDHWLTTREETDAFKQKHGVETTPQTFIHGTRMGGYDALRSHFGLDDPDKDKTSYQPVIAVFVAAAAIAAGISLLVYGSPFTIRAGEWFVSISMMILAMLKLQDVEQFSTMFLNYDLLGRRWVPYAYFYPFGEFVAGALMIAHVLPWLSIPVAAFIGSVGAGSVFLRGLYPEARIEMCMRRRIEQCSAGLHLAHRKPVHDRHGRVDAGAYGLISARNGRSPQPAQSTDPALRNTTRSRELRMTISPGSVAAFAFAPLVLTPPRASVSQFSSPIYLVHAPSGSFSLERSDVNSTTAPSSFNQPFFSWASRIGSVAPVTVKLHPGPARSYVSISAKVSICGAMGIAGGLLISLAMATALASDAGVSG